MRVSKEKFIAMLVCIFMLTFMSNYSIKAVESDIDKPSILDVVKIEEVTELGKKVSLKITAESKSPIRFLSLSLEGPEGNIYGGGTGVAFDKIGENTWQYIKEDFIPNNYPSGEYYYTGLQIENEAFNISEQWQDIKFNIENNNIVDKPIIKKANLNIIQEDENKLLKLNIEVQSKTPVDWLNISLEGPSGNVFGGGSGINFSNIGNDIWTLQYEYRLSNYAPNGEYIFTNISVKNEAREESDQWGNIKFNITDNTYSDEKPVIKNIEVNTERVLDGTNVYVTYLVESVAPIYMLNSSFYAPNKQIYGGGIGVDFKYLGNNLWEYTNKDFISKHSPSGTYYYEDISIENKCFNTSDKWGKVEVYIDNTIEFVPTISVDGIENNKLYNGPVEIKININNYSKLRVKLNNKEFTGGIISEEGNYALEIIVIGNDNKEYSQIINFSIKYDLDSNGNSGNNNNDNAVDDKVEIEELPKTGGYSGIIVIFGATILVLIGIVLVKNKRKI